MIKFTIHPTFFFIFLLALVHGFIYDVLLLFLVVIVHELGHAYMALYFGWRVKKVELLPFGGVAEVEEHGNQPLKEEVLVILAGPLMNIAMISLALLALFIEIGTAHVLIQFLEYNLIILLFNLLPIWPLDGGKLTQSLFSCFLPYKKAINYSLLLSIFGLFLYFLLVIFLYPFYFALWIVAIFLAMAQWLEYRQIPYQFLRFMMSKFRQVQAKENIAQDVVSITLTPTHSVQAALEKLYRNKFHYFCLYMPSGEITAVISETEMLEQFFRHHQPYRAVGEIFR